VTAATLIPGKTTEAELWFIAWSAQAVQCDGAYVELGCYQGRTTAAILDAITGVLLSIDNFTYAPPSLGPSNQQTVCKHLGRLAGRWHCAVGDSTEVPAGIAEVAFLFIDTDHRAIVLNAELDAWLPLMQPGSVIVLHDYCDRHPEMAPVIDQRLGGDLNWERIGLEGATIAFRCGGPA